MEDIPDEDRAFDLELRGIGRIRAAGDIPSVGLGESPAEDLGGRRRGGSIVRSPSLWRFLPPLAVQSSFRGGFYLRTPLKLSAGILAEFGVIA